MVVASLILGICSIVIGFLGGILWGFIGALIGIACGVVAIVLGINVKNQTNGQKGTPAVITGIIGCAVAGIFFIGCLACGSKCAGSYGKWGYVGGTCKASSDISSALSKWY
ncbi:MAG: hypothetical protein IK071_04760 [Lachnospiraceae bacterium]|nr:hypothetical protein [Lachnospiraceae bacterium]